MSDGFVFMEAPASNGCAVVVLSGELDISSVGYLARRHVEVAARRPKRLIIDLSATAFMDCYGARPIAEVRHLQAGNCSVILRRLPPLVRRVLGVVGLAGPCVIDD